MAQSIVRGFRSLHNRNYRIYWIGQSISLVGTWMQTTAQGWLALDLTRSPMAIGLVTTLQFLPLMALSLFGGVIADRFAKRRLVLLMQSLALVQAAVFGTLVGLGMLQLWHLYLLALMLGLINAIDQPARIAFVGDLVSREDLVNAVGLNSIQFNTARIVGPALAGLMIARFGAAPALFFNAASFVAVIVGLLLMDQRTIRVAPPPDGHSVGESLVEGLSYVWRTPQVLLVLVVVAVVGTFGFNFSIVLPLIAGFVLHTGAAGFGLLSSFVGIGALVAAITTAFSRTVTLRRLIAASLAFGILLAASALIPVITIAGVLLVALGFAGVAFATSANTLLQLSVPDRLRGRVMGIYTLLFIGSTPIGALLIGGLSSIASVPTTLVICGALCVLGVTAAVGYHWRMH